MATREVRYCTTKDRVRIAYTVEGSGDGDPLLVCPFFAESFSLTHLLPEYEALIAGMAVERSVIRYDMRGTGLSQHDVSDFSQRELVRDIEAVIAGAGARRCVLFAGGTTGPRAIEFAARHPAQVSRMILYSTFSRAADVMAADAVDALARLALADWRSAAQSFADRSGRREHAELNGRIADVFERSVSGEVAAAFIRELYHADATSYARRIKSPALVISWRETQLFTAELAQQMASAIPGARLSLLEGSASWLGDVDAVIRAAAEFINPDRKRPLRRAAAVSSQAEPAQPSPSASISVVLFTDLVNHTEMMRRLGDARGRDVLREHESITRETLRRHGGAEVKSMGDGFMAQFASVTGALDCAIALQRAFAERNGADAEPLHVRVGLNAGEPIAEDGDLFGSMVILASRIAAEAGPGEIVVPDGVRHLLTGKSFDLTDRGETQLKGFDEATRLYEVSWHA